MLLAFLFLLPILYYAASKLSFKFRWPLLVLVISTGVFAAQFAPPFYAMGTLAGVPRLVNGIYYSYYLLVLLNLFYLSGWIHQQLAKKGIGNLMDAFCRVNSAGIRAIGISTIAALFLVFLYTSGRFTDTTSVSAVHSLRHGEAQAYYTQFQERMDVCRNSEVDDLVFEPFRVRPRVLYFNDITNNRSDWKNESFAEYFDKKLSVLKS